MNPLLFCLFVLTSNLNIHQDNNLYSDKALIGHGKEYYTGVKQYHGEFINCEKVGFCIMECLNEIFNVYIDNPSYVSSCIILKH
jgi:hypothetical protein